LYAGAEEYVMELLSEGRISSGKAAEILDTSIHRIHELAREHSVEVGPDIDDYQRSREATARLLE
jgi:predicted HTH domain antitoxin